MSGITEEKLKRVLFLLAGNQMSFSQIAAEMGCFTSTIARIAKRYGHKSPIPTTKNWTAKEDDAIRNASGTWEEVAEQLGRTKYACISRQQRLQLLDGVVIRKAKSITVAAPKPPKLTGNEGATEALGRAIEQHIAKRAKHYGITPEQYKSISINLPRKTPFVLHREHVDAVQRMAA